jgi:hypothetical protein
MLKVGMLPEAVFARWKNRLIMPTDAPATEQPGLTLDEVREVVAEVSAPGHFFVGGSLRLEWRHSPVEELHWEIFHGRLLDATQTRQRRTFESWNIHRVDGDERSVEPLLSLKLDAEQRRIQVTRGIYSHVWEAYDSGDNVILSRPARKWLRELTAAVDLDRCSERAALRRELAYRLHQAVVGVSRLPLTSVEAPLPAFSLGELAYFEHSAPPANESTPMNSWMDLVDRALSPRCAFAEAARVLECLLRATPAAELPAAAEAFAARWQEMGFGGDHWPDLLLLVFNEAALSPYTNFVDQALAFVRCLEERKWLSTAAHADFLCRLSCLVARHLTAFDLEKFHHRGANYPDALLLDAVLKALLDLIERSPEVFRDVEQDDDDSATAKRLRRRGLRQGWLLRCRYQGHPVPAVPTSPGENSRVLPAEFPHILEEEIADPAKRSRHLFVDERWAVRLTESGREVLRQSIADLRLPLELRELGTALYLDRPLGIHKRPTEPDRTPLLSYIAFSRTVAGRRLKELFGLNLLGSEAELEALRQQLKELPVTGLPLQLSPGAPRPGVPSLRDAFQTAADFVLLCTTGRSVREFWQLFDLGKWGNRLQLDWLHSGKRVLIMAGSTAGTIRCYDDELRQRLEFEFDARHGYQQGLDGEAPAEGLLLTRTWEVSDAGAGREIDVRSQNLRFPAR